MLYRGDMCFAVLQEYAVSGHTVFHTGNVNVGVIYCSLDLFQSGNRMYFDCDLIAVEIL